MPLLTLDQDQPDRLKVVSAPFEGEALRLAGAHWRGRGHDYFHIAKALAAVYRLRGVFGQNLTYDDGVIAWLVAENIEWVKAANWLRSPGVDVSAADPELLAAGRLARYYTEMQRLETTDWAERQFKLRPFQRNGILMLLVAQRAVLADDPGLGKSIQGAAAISLAKRVDPTIGPALVIAPKSTLQTAWVRALTVVDPSLKVMVLSADTTLPKRRKMLASFVADGYDVLVTSYGMIKAHSRAVAYGGTALKRCTECGGPASQKPVTTERCEAHIKELNGINFDTVLVDEAHHIFDQTSLQTRSIHGVAVTANARFRWAMTGTAIEGSPMDWWALLKFVSPDEWGSSVAFRGRYAEVRTNWAGFEEVVGLNPATRQELELATAPRFIRRLEQEVLPDLPEKQDIYRFVELSKRERDAYKQFEEHAITALDGGDLYATNPAVVFGRLYQLACSTGTVDPQWLPVPGDDGLMRFDFGFEPTEPSSLLDEVEDARVGEYGATRPVMFFHHAKLLSLYAARLAAKGVRFAVIDGSVPKVDRDQAVADFNAKQLDTILLTSAGGEGISLVGSSVMFFVQPPVSRIVHQQARGRIHGIGRGDGAATFTQYVYFVPKDTVIESTIATLGDKNRLADSVLGDGNRLDALRELLVTQAALQETVMHNA